MMGASVSLPPAPSRRDRARARRTANVGWCMCGAPVRVDGFRNLSAYREFFRFGLCQNCQDRVLLRDASTPGAVSPLSRGLVVASQASNGAVAALPFLLTGTCRPIVWEARHSVLVGPVDSPCDPWSDLEPMATLLADHQIRVHVAEDAADPVVAELLGIPEFVVALDALELDACAVALDLCVGAFRLPLADALPWPEFCGAPLVPLHVFALRTGFTAKREPDAGALRRCAWLGAALALPLPGSQVGRTVMDTVLSAYPSRFGEAGS